MPDFEIGAHAPGIAGFSSETWGQGKEIILQDTPPQEFRDVSITAGGSDVVIAMNSVIAATGELAAYTSGTPGTTDAIGIARFPITIPAGGTETVSLLVAGNVDMDALVWDASFNSDARKMDAFVLSTASDFDLIVGKNPYTSAAVLGE